MDIVQTHLCFDGKFSHWLDMGMGMENPPTFSIRYGDEYVDVYILAIIPVPPHLSLFKLLKY